MNAANVKSDLRYGKTRNKTHATCLATLLQNQWNSDVALFTTNENKPSFVRRRVRKWVTKRATSVFDSLCNNVAKRVAVFCCPFLCNVTSYKFPFISLVTQYILIFFYFFDVAVAARLSSQKIPFEALITQYNFTS